MIRIKTTTSALCYFAAGLSIGLVANYLQQQVWPPDHPNPIVQACTSIEYKSMKDFVARSGYQAYKRSVGLVLGDSMVCSSTQQIYQWIQENNIAGLLLLGLKIMLQVPVMVLTVVEGGRRDNPGILLCPTLFFFFYYCFGTSVIFPSLFVSSYCLLGDHPYTGGSTDLWRGPVALAVALPSALLYLATICSSPDSSIWNTCAGLMGSPILAALPLLAWNMRPPAGELSSKQAIASAKALAATYSVLGGLSFLAWLGLVYAFATTYGMSDLQQFAKDVWYDPSVKAVCVEVWSLGLGWMTLIASRSEWSVLEALVLTPFLGPGAALSVELASLELEKYSIPMPAQKPVRASNNNTNSNTKRKKKKKQ